MRKYSRESLALAAAGRSIQGRTDPSQEGRKGPSGWGGEVWRGGKWVTADLALGLTRDMLWTGILISAPVLLLSMLVGLLISIVQVVTQVQEMSLTFVPKILTVAFVLIGFGPWMMRTLLHFSTSTIGSITTMF